MGPRGLRDARVPMGAPEFLVLEVIPEMWDPLGSQGLTMDGVSRDLRVYEVLPVIPEFLALTEARRLMATKVSGVMIVDAVLQHRMVWMETRAMLVVQVNQDWAVFQVHRDLRDPKVAPDYPDFLVPPEIRVQWGETAPRVFRGLKVT